jgi:hypothetical protein
MSTVIRNLFARETFLDIIWKIMCPVEDIGASIISAKGGERRIEELAVGAAALT